jgi:hypothetical protein
VDLSRMNHVLAIQTENLTATVQAGVTREQLNRELAQSGFFFPRSRRRWRSAAWLLRAPRGRTRCATARCARTSCR